MTGVCDRGKDDPLGKSSCQSLRLCVCVLPSVMQKTLRKASSWAEMGGSLQCRAKMLDLKEQKVTNAIMKVTNGRNSSNKTFLLHAQW